MIGNDILEVKSKIDIGCGYFVSFGETYFCLCPTSPVVFKKVKPTLGAYLVMAFVLTHNFTSPILSP